MTAAARPDKYSRYRERQRAKGLKEVRMWVFDPDAPGFRERLTADMARLKAAGDDDHWVEANAFAVEEMIQAEEALVRAENEARKD